MAGLINFPPLVLTRPRWLDRLIMAAGVPVLSQNGGKYVSPNGAMTSTCCCDMEEPPEFCDPTSSITVTFTGVQLCSVCSGLGNNSCGAGNSVDSDEALAVCNSSRSQIVDSIVGMNGTHILPFSMAFPPFPFTPDFCRYRLRVDDLLQWSKYPCRADSSEPFGFPNVICNSADDLPPGPNVFPYCTDPPTDILTADMIIEVTIELRTPDPVSVVGVNITVSAGSDSTAFDGDVGIDGVGLGVSVPNTITSCSPSIDENGSGRWSRSGIAMVNGVL
jgi:hypothetical protein